MGGQRIRDDKAFYTGWLLKKLEKFCEFKNWDYPEITCLKTDNYAPNISGTNAALDSEGDSCMSLRCFAASLQLPSFLSCCGADDTYARNVQYHDEYSNSITTADNCRNSMVSQRIEYPTEAARDVVMGSDNG